MTCNFLLRGLEINQGTCEELGEVHLSLSVLDVPGLSRGERLCRQAAGPPEERAGTPPSPVKAGVGRAGSRSGDGQSWRAVPSRGEEMVSSGCSPLGALFASFMYLVLN